MKIYFVWSFKCEKGVFPANLCSKLHAIRADLKRGVLRRDSNAYSAPSITFVVVMATSTLLLEGEGQWL